MVLGWRIRAAIYRFGQALAAHKKGLPVSPFFYPSISRFMPSAFELSDLIAKALAPKPKAKSCPAGGICYQFIRESPNIFKPAEIQHVQTGGHSAVLPHTALQSVVSSSGLARSCPGCIHDEQSQVCEVRIWPASVIVIASSHSGALFLLAQYLPEPPSDKSVNRLKRGSPRVFEIAKPAA